MAAESDLERFQRDFAAALLGERPTPALRRLTAQAGFAVHRNTVLRGCVDALVANYPTVWTLVGAAWFDAAACRFARAQPPREGSLASYGAGFAEFLDDVAPPAGLPYLGGVARLDRAWTESHLAADAPALTSAALAGVTADGLLDTVLVPHPAARWVRSATLPIFAIWRAHREHDALDDVLARPGDGGLVTRPGATVQWQEIGVAAAAFLDACARGQTFATAAAAAGDRAPEAIARWLPALVGAGAFARMERAAAGAA